MNPAATATDVELSFVIALYNTGPTLSRLLEAFQKLDCRHAWELVLVDDGSTDDTAVRLNHLPPDFPAPITCVRLARNYGEHAAVLEGCRRSVGKYVVCLDDDLQNPPAEALRLAEHLISSGADVAYSFYEEKKHHWFRNLGSRVVNACASYLLNKPKDLYLSSFRALRRELLERITVYRGPYPYIDGMILGATDRITRLKVSHAGRYSGKSGYTPRKLVRLALTMLCDFSVMPLRIASVLGVLLCLLGLAIVAEVVLEMALLGRRQAGWASLMGALTVFSGAQLLMLGIIGEYVGRAFLTISGKPQSFVRSVEHHPAAGGVMS